MAPSTRDRILDAAWRLFVERGFEATTITQIEAASSLAAGSGSFYRHFPSKQAVLRAVVDREVDRVDAARELGPELSGTEGDVRVALTLEFHRRLDNLRRLHPLMVLVQRERAHLGRSARHLEALLVGRNLAVRSERLRGWMAGGAIPARDADALAAAIMSALVGYHLSVEFFQTRPGDIGEEAFISVLVELVAGE